MTTPKPDPESVKDFMTAPIKKTKAEEDAINGMFSHYSELKKLGWKEAIYCPKDGSM